MPPARAIDEAIATRDDLDAPVVLQYEGDEITVYSDGHVGLSDLSAGDESVRDPIEE